MNGLQQAEALDGSEVILPAQWIEMCRPDIFDSSTARAQFAVLERSIKDFYGVDISDDDLRPQHKRRRVQNEAREWIRDRRADGPFAFEVICGSLRIDSDWLRAGLMRALEPKFARINLVGRRQAVLPIRKRIRRRNRAVAAAVAS